jgi:hypothetical protein
MTSSNRAVRQRVAVLVAGLAGALALGACSEESPPVTIRNLDRPNVVAFGCFGDRRMDGGDVVRSAQPFKSCVDHAKDEPPEGQDDLDNPPRLFAFLLQDSRGTVAVIDVETQSVLDSDPLTPGKNAIPVGTLPVGLAPDRSGCFMVSSSAASCDLTALDVTSALDLQAAAGIAQISIDNSQGVRMRAKARTLVGGPQEEVSGAECPASPTGLVYLAYPACHLVAAVDAGTGRIQAGVQFDADGNGVVVDGSVTCPDECGDGSVTGSLALGGPEIDAGVLDAGVLDAGVPPDAGPPSVDGDLLRPVALHLGEDGRMYVASENSPKITVIDLDAAGLPVESESIQLQGEVGVTALSLSPQVGNGGVGGVAAAPGGTSRFLYAVATDRTVRVVKVEGDSPDGEPRALTECNTQVDPRSLADDPTTLDDPKTAEVENDEAVRDPGLLACLPTGDPAFPSRSGALSPGIQLPGDQIPLDVAFKEIRPPTPEEGEEPTEQGPAPLNLSGTFAFVTSSQGNVYIVNVDDDVYPDFEDPADPAAVSMTLALPHQIRDRGVDRGSVRTSCGAPSTDPNVLGPRVDSAPRVTFSLGSIAVEKIGLMPSVRQIACEHEDTVVPASELSFLAPVEDREVTFPDWRAVLNENWSVAWEGVLSRDGFASSVDGPAVRSGVISVDGFRIRLDDPSGSFCQLGAEALDEVRLLGCDPTVGNGQCGLGETCYVHPETPAEVTSGVCLPTDRAESLSRLCRDFLVSHRRYSATEVKAGSVALIPRRRVLQSSPLDGCTSDDECEEMAKIEQSLADPAHPFQLDLPASGLDWVCTDDPSRPAGPDRCLVACESTDDCQAGDACLAGFCNQGAPPFPECVEAVQRYQVRASDAFVVIGSTSGYLHNWEKGADDDACVLKEDPDPLAVGRIPLRPEDCAGPTALTPNPCVTTVSHARTVTPFAGEQCQAGTPEVRIDDEVRAIRFQNPSLRFDLVNTEIQGDAACIGDGAAGLPPFSPLHTDFGIDINLIGGFIPMSVQFAFAPTFPVHIQPGPDERIWVIDQGDGGGAFGKVYTFVPSAAQSLFSTAIIQ